MDAARDSASVAVDPGSSRRAAPRHLWIVGVLALLWNAMGAFDYLATQMELEGYMSQFDEAQLAWFHGFPAWVVSAWALAVWSALLGSVALLLRKRWALWLFGVSLVGLAGTTLHNFGFSNGVEIMGTGGVLFSVAVWVVAILLFLYAGSQAGKGVLA